MAQLVDDEVLVRQRRLHENQVPRGIAAEAPETGDTEEPRRHDHAHAAEVDRLGIEVEPVEPGLGPAELGTQELRRRR